MLPPVIFYLSKRSQYGKRAEPLKVEKPVLECSSEMDNLRCITDTALSPVTKIIVMGTNLPSRGF